MATDCILCGTCISVCPLIKTTGREELGPRAKSDLYMQLKGDESGLASLDVAKLAGMCLGCHRCKSTCPRGVSIPELVAELRGAHPNFKSWLWKTWLTNANTLWSAGSSAAKLVPTSMVPDKLGQQLKMLAGLKGGSGMEPCLKPESFPDTNKGEKMLLFAGCTATHVQGRWLMAALRLLDGLGVEVLSGDFACCGGGLKAAGFKDETKDMVALNVRIWREACYPKIVGFCASCLAGLAGYDCFEDEKERERWLSCLTPLSNLLHDTEFVVSDNAPETLAYHRPCHGDASDGDLLKAAFGDRLVAATDKECCGFGGIMRLGAPEVTNEVNQRCWDVLGGADAIVSGCSACVGQLTGTAAEGKFVGHWLELIA